MYKAFTLIFVVATMFAKAQIKISGKVTDNKSKPLIGISVALKNTYDGGTSDSSGNFLFTTSEKGNQIIEVTATGYKAFEQKINITNANINLAITLKEMITELSAVIITAGSFEASDKKKGTVLNSLDIVTTAGANADITSALKTLPGTQQVGESEGLFVRGGSATESKIFIDGNLVNNFYFSSLPGVATRGRFNPFLFKGTVFSTGGYSALYGQALSAALILESNDLPDKTEANLGLSPLGINGGIQKLSKNKKASWGVSYGYTNLALTFAVIPQNIDFFKTPIYHEGDINARIKTKRGGILKYYGYFSSNQTGIRNADIDSINLKDVFTIKNLNTFQNISYKQSIGNAWKINAAISFSTNKDNIVNELDNTNNVKQIFYSPDGYATKNFGVINTNLYTNTKLVLEKNLGGINAVRFGTDYFYSNEKSSYTLFNGAVYNNTAIDNLNALFAETDFYVTNNLALKVGSRAEHSTLMNKWNVTPRASLAYKFKDKSQMSFAYGIFYQNPERKYLPAINNNLKYSQATHYILQYQKNIKDRIFRTELFYKKYKDLFKTAFNSYGQQVAANNDGYGYAQGVEIFWRDKKTIKNLDYWISYSYLDTKRNYLNFPTSITPNFAATHSASLVLKKFVTQWKTGFNVSYNFTTGRPYYNIAFDSVQNKFQLKDYNKTINYNNLSFSLNYLPNLGNTTKKAFAVWVLSINNLLAQKQVFTYNYSTLNNNNKIAVGPPYKRFIYIGCFLSFGIDRTQDAIDNHL